VFALVVVVVIVMIESSTEVYISCSTKRSANISALDIPLSVSVC
jgi:hypothetical protein